MKILALDLSTWTGWAHNCGPEIRSGRQPFPLQATPGHRFNAFRRWLREQVRQLQPEVIVVELAHLRGWDATVMAVGMYAVVQMAAAEFSCRVRTIHTSTLKLYAAGDGHADKPAMKAAAAARFPHYDPLADGPAAGGGDESDALHMLAWGMDRFPKPASPKKPTKSRKPAAGGLL